MQIKLIFTPKVSHLASLRRTEFLELETAYLINGTRAYFPASFARSHQSLLTISRPFISFTSLRVPEKMKYIRIDEKWKKKSLQKHLIINLPSSFSEILMAAYLKKEYIKMSATSTCKKDQKTKRNVINWWCCLLRCIVLTSSFSVEAWTWKCHQCLSQVIGKACSPHFSPKIQETRPLLHYSFINK